MGNHLRPAVWLAGGSLALAAVGSLAGCGSEAEEATNSSEQLSCSAELSSNSAPPGSWASAQACLIETSDAGDGTNSSSTATWSSNLSEAQVSELSTAFVEAPALDQPCALADSLPARSYLVTAIGSGGEAWSTVVSEPACLGWRTDETTHESTAILALLDSYAG